MRLALLAICAVVVASTLPAGAQQFSPRGYAPKFYTPWDRVIPAADLKCVDQYDRCSPTDQTLKCCAGLTCKFDRTASTYSCEENIKRPRR